MPSMALSVRTWARCGSAPLRLWIVRFFIVSLLNISSFGTPPPGSSRPSAPAQPSPQAQVSPTEPDPKLGISSK